MEQAGGIGHPPRPGANIVIFAKRRRECFCFTFAGATLATRF
jgi:hypothetical protein